MKKSALKHVLTVAATAGCLLGGTSNLLAHDTWAVMKNYNLGKTEAPVVDVVSSHVFTIPARDLVSTDRVEKVFFLAPDGSKTPAVPLGKEAFHAKHALKTSGTHVAVVITPPGFSSKTTDGYKQGKTKKDLNNVVSCSYSQKFSKALFTVGTPGGEAFSRTLGHSLEIIPLQDPARMKKDEVLPVKVLFQGKPLPSVNVSGVYAGFTDDPGTFAYSTSTNKEGIAKIKLIHNGPWLVLVKQKEAYPDTAVCDAKSYSSALTFNVR